MQLYTLVEAEHTLNSLFEKANIDNRKFLEMGIKERKEQNVKKSV